MGRHTREQREGYIEARRKITPLQGSTNLNRPNQTAAAMSKRREVVDLTTDDDPPTESRSARVSRGATLDITSAPTKSSQSAHPRRSVNGSSQTTPRVDNSRPQNSQTRRAPDSNVDSSRTKEQSSGKRASQNAEVIELDESVVPERTLPKNFKLPRGLDPLSQNTPSSQASGVSSATKGTSPSKRKRPSESESPLTGLSDRSSPTKRQRVEPKDSSNAITQNGSQRPKLPSRDGLSQPAKNLSPSRATSGTRLGVESKSPSVDKATPKSRGSKDDFDHATTPKTKQSPSVVVVNGRHSTSSSNSKREDEGQPSKNLQNSTVTSANKQQHHESKASARESRGSSDLGPIPFRKQKPPNLGEANAVNGNGASASARIRKDSELNQPSPRENGLSTSASREPNGVKTSNQKQGSATDKQRDNSEPSSKGPLESPANQNSPPRSKLTTGSSLEGSVGAVRRATPDTMAPNGIKASKKTSFRDDEDDASPVFEAGRHSHKKSRRDPEDVSVRELNNESNPSSRTVKPSEARSQKEIRNRNAESVNDPDKLKASEKASETSTAGAVISKAPAANGKHSQTEVSSNQSQTKEVEPPQSPEAGLPSDSTTQNPDKSSAENFKDSPEESALPEQTSRKSFTEAEEADQQLQREAMQDVLQQDTAKEAQEVFVPPTISASALRASSMFSALPLANRVEKVLGRYLEELRGDDEYWTGVSMRRARLSNTTMPYRDPTENSATQSEELTSFAHLKPLNFPIHKKGGPSTKSDEELWHTQRMSEGKSQAAVDRSAKFVTFTTDTADVPDYAHYVSIKSNILAPNVVHLHCWPYFSDDFDISKAENLHGQYIIDIGDRERKLLLLLRTQKYESYVESALQDLECSWADVLRFLLEPSPDVGPDLDARKAYQNRPQYCEEDFSRNSDRWVAVLSSLPPSTPEKLGRVAVLCENFQKLAKFSLWHIAKRSDFASLPEKSGPPVLAQPSDDQLTCRICLRFNCPYHGQFKHHADDSGSESDDSASVDSVVAMDIEHPLKANYRSRIAFPTESAIEPMSNPDAPSKKRQKDPNYWNSYKNKAEDRGPFYPCNHPGSSCEDAKCRCFERNIPCEKSCGCPPTCHRKFKGCSCGLRKGHKLVCFEDADCACYQLGRECDPDLCGTCGVCDVVDPVNKYKDGILIGRCRNASIQRGVPKHTLLGDSGVHGLGLYACESIKQNDFVGEYKGEIITKREADRRGAVYEHQKLSYLFSLNKAQEIDSTYFGNKVRFINHAHGDKANLYPRIIMVNTVHRIALYAGKDILAGKELLFDYGPYFPDDQLQGKKSKKSAPPESKKSAPHVRNANLVKEFFDVEESEDEDGILRAKAVSHRAAGTKGRANGKKPRGGARPNAGRKPQPAKASDRQTPQNREAQADKSQNAEERLATFNISDDLSSGRMEVDGDWGAEEDEAFEPELSESDDSEESGESERSDDSDDEDEEDEDELNQLRTSRRRAAVSTRNRM